MIRQLLLKFREIIMYGIIGVTCIFIDFIIYTILCNFIDNYQIANICSVIVGILCSFTLNRAFTFKVRNHTFRRLQLFFLVGMFGLGISSFILFILVENLFTSETTAKLIAIVIVSLIQFLLNKFVTFRK